jgi:hypothetical protein
MSVTFEKAYRKEVDKALEKCQFIEEVLRKCISSALEIARLHSSSNCPIKTKTENISKLTLGGLVNLFSKINNDTKLHESLRNITLDRNNVAHRSHLFTLRELNDKVHMAEEIRKMKEIVTRATKVHNNVLIVREDFVRFLHEVKRSRVKD